MKFFVLSHIPPKFCRLPALFAVIASILLSVNICFAQSSDDVDAFILQAEVNTYDCPSAEHIDQINAYLGSDSISSLQRYQLTVEKTHWIICSGKHTDAEATLTEIIDDELADKSAEYYADAVYQLGYVYDVLENPKRCELYRQAKDISKDKYDDVHLSAQLGLITVCNPHNDDSIKFSRLYSLLESYSKKSDKAAIAHIHNNIGLLYGAIGQHVLAAEQFHKSYEMGLGTYKSSNQLATLISEITSHMGSGDFDAAKISIEEFKRVNQKINTPMTNVWLHFAESGYHYRLGNFSELKNSLARWRVFQPEINSRTYARLYDWFNAALCLSEKDKKCVTEFLERQQEANASNQNFLKGNKDYLKLLVDMHIFLGDLEATDLAFQKYSEVMLKMISEQQGSGKVMGVANLHNEIIKLETSLAQERRNRLQAIIIVSLSFAIIIASLLFLIRRKYLARIKIDSVTGLLNSKSAISRIKRVDSPSPGRTNALALFDLRNFRDVNRQLGSVNSEETLRQIARSLKNVTRERDILGRFAPEQFIVCLIDIEEDSAKSFFERIRYALENTMLSDREERKVSVRSSMSIYITNDTFGDMNDILEDMQMSLDISAESKSPLAPS